MTSRKGQKRCKAASCGEWFKPFNSLQQTCMNAKCAIEFSNSKKGSEFVAKQGRAEDRGRTKKINDQDRGHWLKKAKFEFHRFIRLRDHYKPCISCGHYYLVGDWHAGHFMSVGAHKDLEFVEINVHKECNRCNTYDDSHLVGYADNLPGRIDAKWVEWLKGPHDPANLKIADFKEIHAKYKALNKQMKANIGNDLMPFDGIDREFYEYPEERQAA